MVYIRARKIIAFLMKNQNMMIKNCNFACLFENEN